MEFYILEVVFGFVILYSLIKIVSLKFKKKVVGTIVGFHQERGINRDNDIMYTIVRYDVNGEEVESRVKYYNIFMKIGKKINVYYDQSNYYKIEVLNGYIFILVISLLFLSVILIIQ